MVAVVLAVAFLLPGASRHSLGEHCARISPAEAGHHGAGHDAPVNNTRDHDSDPCPHCPPAECATAVSCATSIVATLDPVSAATPLVSALHPDQLAPRLRFNPSAPPTPPPQDPFRIA